MDEVLGSLGASLERLAAAAQALESAAARLEQSGEAQRGEVAKITAAIESSRETERQEGERREAELERRLAEVEVLRAGEAGVSASRGAGRKTLPAATVQLLAKQGIDGGDAVDVQTLDAALAGLGVEQRIAVKSQMLRTGALVR